MPVNKEELQKDLATPEYQELVRTELAKKEFVIRDKASETTFLDNYKKDIIEKEVPIATKASMKQTWDTIDKDTKELFGVDRLDQEKTSDYFKRASKLKLDEIKELNEKIKKGDTSGVLTKKLEEAEQQYKNQLKVKDEELETLKKTQVETGKAAAMDRAYAGVRALFKKELPPLFSRTERAVLDDILKTAVLKEGVLYAGNTDGSIKKTKDFVEIKMEDYLKDEFKEVIEVKKVGSGAGSSGGGTGKEIDPNTITLETFTLPEGIKSQDDLMTHMLSIGLDRKSEVFGKIFKKFAVDAKLPLTTR